jgi:protein-S-isoprenylcysteine O-methyltransferase Ste14
MSAIIKTIIFTLVLPCTIVVWAPWRWLVPGGPHLRLDGWRGLGVVLFAIGAAIYFWCAFWAFARVGGGTPAPIDPPRKLVVHGLYRYVRNPMYIGVLSMLASETIVVLEHRTFTLYALSIAAAFAIWVLIYEEPALRSKFGAQYEEYCRQVPRWIPRLHPGDTRHAV